MVDQETLASQLIAERFPFPREADITLTVRNADYSHGPVMLHLVMQPGSFIPAHRHEGIAEVLYMLDGDFTNGGKQYGSGTSLHIKAGTLHGPHTSPDGLRGPRALD